ncbi:glycosyltransferase [Halomonas denitrificans]|uniref:glycosyltransferase n=1 Tax=Halomonas denitrificans TaxID=370769 RepID=UPI001CD5BB88|nr:glycosyltransferase [Halomonas denitrificans]MCA0976708.1 glycosyltransferase [Halomonas denitrificans]
MFLIDHLDSGGAPVVVRDLMLGMLRFGVRVTLVILSDRQRYKLPPDIRVAQIPPAKSTWLTRYNRYSLHAKLLDRWLACQPNGFDLVLAHLHHAHQVVSRSRIAMSAWYCLHADPVTGFLGNKQGLGRWLKRRKVRHLYDGKRILTVSSGMLRRLIDHFGVRPCPGESIHNPLNVSLIRDLSQHDVSDVPVDFLLFVGRMDLRQKRLDRLLDAYKMSGVHLPLVLIGGGSNIEKVKGMVRERELTPNVLLVGSKDNPFAYMARARALLLSSDYEGFSLVLAEALACRTPVVSVDCPSGPAEILTGPLSRWLVPLNDPKAFAQTIRDVVANPPKIAEDACQRFDVSLVVKRYLALDGGPVSGGKVNGTSFPGL